MISLLSTIVHMFVCWVQTGVTLVVNALIIALALIVGTVVGLMPTIPSAPDLPQPMLDALSWIAWFFPVGTLVAAFAFVAGAMLIWFGVSVILRWAKAI